MTVGRSLRPIGVLMGARVEAYWRTFAPLVIVPMLWFAAIVLTTRIEALGPLEEIAACAILLGPYASVHRLTPLVLPATERADAAARLAVLGSLLLPVAVLSELAALAPWPWAAEAMHVAIGPDGARWTIDVPVAASTLTLGLVLGPLVAARRGPALPWLGVAALWLWRVGVSPADQLPWIVVVGAVLAVNDRQPDVVWDESEVEFDPKLRLVHGSRVRWWLRTLAMWWWSLGPVVTLSAVMAATLGAIAPAVFDPWLAVMTFVVLLLPSAVVMHMAFGPLVFGPALWTCAGLAPSPWAALPIRRSELLTLVAALWALWIAASALPGLAMDGPEGAMTWVMIPCASWSPMVGSWSNRRFVRLVGAAVPLVSLGMLMLLPRLGELVMVLVPSMILLGAAFVTVSVLREGA